MSVEFTPVTTTYEKLPVGFHARVEAKIVLINRRLAKLGAPAATVTYGPIVERKVKDPDTGWVHTVREYEFVTVTGVEAKLAGWTAIASLDHTVHPTEAWVTRFPGHHDDAIDPMFVSRGSVCDHCGVKIKRNLTVLFAHDDGRWAQVGTSCVLDYLGIDPKTILWLAACADGMADDDPDAGGGWNARRVPSVTEYLAAAAEATEINGFVPTVTDFGGWPTRDQAMQIVDGKTKDAKTGMPIWPGLDSERGAAKAALVIDWVLTSTADSEFMVSARRAVEAGQTHGRTIGLLAALPYSYGKAMERAASKAAEAAAPSEHFGKVGDKIVATGKIITIRTFDGDYGPKRLIVVALDNGNQVSTIGTGQSLWNVAEGEIVEVKGKIKSHEDKGYGKRTVLTMVKLELAELVAA